MKSDKIVLIMVLVLSISLFIALLGEAIVWTPFGFVLLIPIVVLGMFWALLSGRKY